MEAKQYKRALEVIPLIKDKKVKNEQMIFYAQVLLKQNPKLTLDVLRAWDRNNNPLPLLTLVPYLQL